MADARLICCARRSPWLEHALGVFSLTTLSLSAAGERCDGRVVKKLCTAGGNAVKQSLVPCASNTPMKCYSALRGTSVLPVFRALASAWHRFGTDVLGAVGGTRAAIHSTGQGSRLQIWLEYSVMVRSLENLPEPATFRMAIRAHSSGFA
jgi:hypothetical protein